jgi:hypothetical protein
MEVERRAILRAVRDMNIASIPRLLHISGVPYRKYRVPLPGYHWPACTGGGGGETRKGRGPRIGAGTMGAVVAGTREWIATSCEFASGAAIARAAKIRLYNTVKVGDAMRV